MAAEAPPLDAKPVRSGPSDLELVNRARLADRRAFEALFHRHYPRVFNFARRLESSYDSALDITQTAFVRAYASLDRLRDDESFLAWMYRIVVNLVRDRARSARRKPWISFSALRLSRGEDSSDDESVEFADESLDPERMALREEREAKVVAAIRQLPLEFREVVILHHIEAVPLRDVARILGIPEGTAKSRLGRARARLREMLGGYLNGGGEEN